MRVTSAMLSANFLTNLYGNLKALNKYQNQLSTDSRITRLSDDPIAAVSSIQIGNDLSKNVQFSKNIFDAKAWLTTTEDILSEMNEVLARTSELALQAGNGTYSIAQRTAILKEAEELKDHYISMANTKFAGKYIFGGYNTTSAPFKAQDTAVSYNSIADLSAATAGEIAAESAQVRQYKISAGMEFDVSVSGLQVMGYGDDNIFNLFNGFITALNTDDATAELSEYGAKFTAAQDKILALVSEVGGRQARLDLMTDRAEQENLNLSELHTKVAGIDKARVITHYKMAESTYNAALQVGAQIIQLSLVDYLR